MIYIDFSTWNGSLPEDMMSALFYVFERCLMMEENPIALSSSRLFRSFGIVLLIDCKSLSSQHLPPMKILSVFLKSLSRHYPHCISSILVVNSNWIVPMVYDMISYAISEVTKKKIKFLKDDLSTTRQALQDIIDLKLVPKEYGGYLDLIPFDVEQFLNSDRILLA